MASFDGSNKGMVGHGQNIPYHTFTSIDNDAVIARCMAKASPEAIKFLDPLNYPGPKVIVDASTLTLDQWHAMRKDSIGASAAGHVFGDTPYPGCTNLDLYNEKIGLTPVVLNDEMDEIQRELNFEYGHLMEQYLQKYTELRWPRGNLVIDTNVYSDPIRPFLTANLDAMLRLSSGEYVHVEYKTASLFGKEAYDNGAIPSYYKRQLIQCQHIMGVWRSFLIVSFSNNPRDGVIVCSYERDLDEEMEQVMEEENFWNNHVLARIPPEPKGPVDNLINCVRQYSGYADNGAPPVQLSLNMIQHIERIQEIEKRIAELNRDKKYLEEQKKREMLPITQIMGASTTATATDGQKTYNITWKARSASLTCDYERLKVDRPDVYREYVTKKPEGARIMKVKET